MSKIDLKPCPFCGTNLSEFPKAMTVKPVRTDEYLLAKLEHKTAVVALAQELGMLDEEREVD